MQLKSFIVVIITFYCSCAVSQSINFDEYDVVLNDTLICKSDFIRNMEKIDSLRLKNITFIPIVDGYKRIYYLNGQLYAEGEIKDKKENGLWMYWHENGQKAREGSYHVGMRTGQHTYWYSNGNLRGIGSFKNDEYDGKWTMYSEDGKEVVEQFYKKGKEIKQK